MALPVLPRDNLPIPVVGAQLFIVSNPYLVIEQCKAGVVEIVTRLKAEYDAARRAVRRRDGPDAAEAGGRLEGASLRMLRPVVVLAALLVVPGIAVAQSMDSRLSDLQRSINALSQQLEQLRVQDQQLQQRMEKMQQNFEQRIERLEKGPAARPTPRTGRSR